MKQHLSPLAVLLCFGAVCVSEVAQAQFLELSRRVPGTANALVLVNVSKLMESPVAQTENWRADRAKRFTSGLTNIPPIADQLVIGAQLDLEGMQPIWEVALVKTAQMPSIESAAKKLEGQVDRVGDLAAVRLPDDSYIVQFSSDTVGLLAPANRQLLGRWIREPAATLSPYLQEAVGYAERGGAVYLALDLADVVTAADVEAKFEAVEDEALKTNLIDKQEVAKVIASIQGAMLGITFGEQVFGKLRIDFGQDAAALAPIAKPLMLYVLSERGVMIDEFDEWTASVQGTRMSLEGSLTASGFAHSITQRSVFRCETRVMNFETLPVRATFCSNGVGTAQLEQTVANNGYRRVIRKAGVERRRPFRVLYGQLSQGLAATLAEVSLSPSARARLPHARPSPPRPHFPPKLSAVSLSLSLQVISWLGPL
jgi:hypothetical protein